MELDDEIKGTLASLSSSLAKTSEIISALNPSLYEEAQQALTDPEARARFHATIAFALNSLYFIYIRCSGQIPQNHPINKEIGRVKQYFDKIKKFSSKEPEPAEQGPTMRIDQDAAERFVRHALGSQVDINAETVEQRAQADASHGRSHKRFTTSNARSMVAPQTNNVLWRRLKATSSSTEEMVDKFLQKKRSEQH